MQTTGKVAAAAGGPSTCHVPGGSAASSDRFVDISPVGRSASCPTAAGAADSSGPKLRQGCGPGPCGTAAFSAPAVGGGGRLTSSLPAQGQQVPPWLASPPKHAQKRPPVQAAAAAAPPRQPASAGQPAGQPAMYAAPNPAGAGIHWTVVGAAAAAGGGGWTVGWRAAAGMPAGGAQPDKETSPLAAGACRFSSTSSAGGTSAASPPAGAPPQAAVHAAGTASEPFSAPVPGTGQHVGSRAGSAQGVLPGPVPAFSTQVTFMPLGHQGGKWAAQPPCPPVPASAATVAAVGILSHSTAAALFPSHLARGRGQLRKAGAVPGEKLSSTPGRARGGSGPGNWAPGLGAPDPRDAPYRAGPALDSHQSGYRPWTGVRRVMDAMMHQTAGRSSGGAMASRSAFGENRAGQRGVSRAAAAAEAATGAAVGASTDTVSTLALPWDRTSSAAASMVSYRAAGRQGGRGGGAAISAARYAGRPPRPPARQSADMAARMPMVEPPVRQAAVKAGMVGAAAACFSAHGAEPGTAWVPLPACYGRQSRAGSQPVPWASMPLQLCLPPSRKPASVPPPRGGQQAPLPLLLACPASCLVLCSRLTNPERGRLQPARISALCSAVLQARRCAGRAQGERAQQQLAVAVQRTEEAALGGAEG